MLTMYSVRHLHSNEPTVLTQYWPSSVHSTSHSLTSAKDRNKESSYTTQYRVLWAVQSALHFTPSRPVHSNANSTSLGSIQPYRNYCRKIIRSHAPTTVHRQVLTELSELRQFKGNKNSGFEIEFKLGSS